MVDLHEPKINSMELTEFTIQRAILRRYNENNWVMIPNYTPHRWWECDMFGLTRSMYFKEWEIKLSKSDYKADFKKGKHVCFNEGNERCPKYFWYVVPKDLISIYDVPEFAGLIYAEIRTDHYQRVGEKYISLNTIKEAPKNKSIKISEREQSHMISILNYRYNDIKFEWRK